MAHLCLPLSRSTIILARQLFTSAGAEGLDFLKTRILNDVFLYFQNMEGFKIMGKGLFEYRKNGRLVEFSVSDGLIHFEDGPENDAARRHESGGGSQPVEAFQHSPYSWVNDYPGLHKAVCEALKQQGY